jgi:DNA-binding HxlR family transcriptional regulator
MEINYQDKTYNCSFELAVDMFGGKWKGLVLWNLNNGVMRNGELKRAIPKITQKMLTQTLRDLETHKLITRKVYQVVPPKVEYTITDEAKKLIPILQSIQDWGNYMVSNLDK